MGSGAPIEFRSRTLSSRYLDPAHDFKPVEAQVEVRWDPLTGYAARIVKARSALLAPPSFNLEELASSTRASCPFCAERIEQATPKFPAEICAEGRIRRGQAVLFPNLLTYTKHSAVGVYSPGLHYLPLDQMTASLVSDNVSTHVEYIRAAMRNENHAVWASINANHMLPSGSSLFHPHLQSSIDPFPSTAQQMLGDVPGERFRAYLETEK